MSDLEKLYRAPALPTPLTGYDTSTQFQQWLREHSERLFKEVLRSFCVPRHLLVDSADMTYTSGDVL